MKYHLRLSKGLSYSGVLSATKQQPDAYTDDKAVADQAVASGYFVLVEQEQPSDEGKSPDEGKQKKGKAAKGEDSEGEIDLTQA